MAEVYTVTVPSLNATVRVKGAADEDHARRVAYRRYVQHTGALLAWFFDDMGLDLPPEWADAEVTRG